jgi:hypothetical protein
MRKFIVVSIFCFSLILSGQGIGSGTISPHASALRDVNEHALANPNNQVRILTGANIINAGADTVALQYAIGVNKWIVIGS